MTKDAEWKQAERQRKQAAGLVRVTVDEWVPSDRTEEYRKAVGRLKRMAAKLRED